MKKILILLAAALSLGAVEIAPYIPAPHDFKRAEVVRAAGPSVRSLNGEWKFSGLANSAVPFPADADKGLELPEYDDSGWGTIPVPLDWYQKYPGARQEKECYVKGFYRRTFQLFADDLAGKRIILKFDCVGYDAKVFLNGKEVGSHRGDFTPFEVDATEAAKAGENLLALRVLSDFGSTYGSLKTIDHVYGTQWWIGSICGGIWQNVALSIEPELRIRTILITPRLASESVEVDYVIENHTGKPFAGTLAGEVRSAMKADAGEAAGTVSIPVKLNAGENKGRFTLKMKNPELWSVNRPYLYFLTLSLNDGQERSTAQRRFGFREFHARNGKFYLNNEEIYLFGENIAPVNFGGLGKSETELEKELTYHILGCRNLGYVMMRTSHQPILPLALEIADECGMMIFHEWGWSFSNDLDPERFIPNNLRELREFVESSYNYPSVAMWSLGNEVVHGDSYGLVAKAMDAQVDLVHELDRQKRPVSTFSGQAGWQSYGRNPLKTDVLDLHTYVSLASPWTERNEEADRIYKGLLQIYKEKERLSRPLVAWENVGFSWGFEYANSKNADFKRNDVDEYLRYAGRDTTWADPQGIGYTGCMSLAEAVDPAVDGHVPMSRFGRRIFELYRLDRRFTGFAPWFNRQPELKTATLWNQPFYPSIHNEINLFPRNLYVGESSRWIAEVVNGKAGMTLEVALFDGTISRPITELAVAGDGRQPVELAMPQVAPGRYQLRLTLREGENECGRNYYDVRLRKRPAPVKPVRPVYIYDTGVAENTAVLAEYLAESGIPFKTVKSFAGVEGLVIIPPEKKTQLLKLRTDVEADAFMKRGGILLVMEQKNPQSEFPGNLTLLDDPLAFADPVLTGHPVLTELDAHSFDGWNNPDKGYVVTRSFMPLTANVVIAKGVRLSRKNFGMALVEAKVGSGRMILSQLEVTASAPRDSAAATYLRNLFAYAAGSEELWDGARELISAGETGYAVVPERIVAVDLAPYANRSFIDEIPGDGKGGWTDQGENDFRMMPTGRIQVAGVPFEIIDPARNGDKSCLVLAGTERNYFPEAIKGIKVGRKLSRLFFLHTAAWGGQPEAGRYRICYADGKTVDYVLNGNRNIGDWWGPVPLPEAKIGILKRNPQGVFVGTYVAEWENPRSGVEIASVDFLSPLFRDKSTVDWLPTHTAVPVLIAMSGETAHESPLEITGTAYRTIYGAGETGSLKRGEAKERREKNLRVWEITFPASEMGEIPAAFFQFSPDSAGNDYRYLTLVVKSDRPARIQLVLPERNWKGSCRGEIELIGDNQYHTYRLRIGNELKRGNFSLTDMRGELFFFYRSEKAYRPDRPAVKFTVKRAVLE